MKLRHTDPAAVVAVGMQEALRGERWIDDPVKGAALMRAIMQANQSPREQRKVGIACMHMLIQHHKGPAVEGLEKLKEMINDCGNP